MKNSYSILKSTVQCYIYFFKLQWMLSKSSILLLIISHFVDTLNSLIVVVFPGYILNCLTNEMYRDFVIITISFATFEFIVKILKARIQMAYNIQKEKCKMKLHQKLIEKTTTLRQEQLEHPEIFERFELARTCANDQAVLGFLSNVISTVFLVIEMAGLFYILKDMPIWGLFIFIFGTVIYAVANRIISKKSIEKEEEENHPTRVMRYFSYEVPKPTYAKEIRTFEFQPFISRRHAETLEESITVTKEYLRHISNAQQYTKLVECVFSVFFYTYNILRFASEEIDIGTFTIHMSAIFRFSQITNGIVSRTIDSYAKSIRLKKILDFLEMPSLSTGRASVTPYDKNSVIEFVNVSYRYPGAEADAISNINIKIRFGEKVSIVGPNGAGKTTFVALMTGLYKPTSGKILYNGVDIEKLDEAQYKQLFAVLLQDYHIYGFTVLNNILFKENPTEQELVSAQRVIDMIGMHDVVESLPNGGDTYMTQRFDASGVELSGGEEQKLAIARVLYRDSPICVLDEPTAALSPTNEYDIYKRFSELTKQKTVIYISHRLASCRLCDRVLVFEKGSIIEDGNHETLMNNNALYAEMFKKQAELYV